MATGIPQVTAFNSRVITIIKIKSRSKEFNILNSNIVRTLYRKSLALNLTHYVKCIWIFPIGRPKIKCVCADIEKPLALTIQKFYFTLQIIIMVFYFPFIIRHRVICDRVTCMIINFSSPSPEGSNV